MGKIAICLLLGAAAVSSVQIHYEAQPLLTAAGFAVAPQASGYIVRSDNGGPANLIQLGAHAYSQPQVFSPPLPLAAQPLYTSLNNIEPAINSYGVVEPAVHAPVLAQPIVVAEEISDDSDDDDDEDSDESEENDEDSADHYDGDNYNAYTGVGDARLGLHHGHGFEQGGGNNYNDARHSSHGEKGSKGYSSKHHSDKGESGHHGSEDQKSFYEEGAGEKENHYDEADKYGDHHEAAKSHAGEDYGEKKSHSKGEKTDGYHKVYHKDEYKKDTDFYDESDKSGHFNKHGYYDNRHGTSDGGYKKGGKHSSGHAQKGYGKKGHYASGHHDAEDRGYSTRDGADNYHENHEDYASKAGDSNDKEYGYSEH